MSQLILMIARIDDLDNPETLTEVWRRAMPVVDLNGVTPEHYLDGMENRLTEVGWEAMRNLLVEQWRLTDDLLVAGFRQQQAGVTVGDGLRSVESGKSSGSDLSAAPVMFPAWGRPPQLAEQRGVCRNG